MSTTDTLSSLNLIKYLKLAARVLGVWLLVVTWWGNLLVNPAYMHTMVVKDLLPYLLLFSIILLFLGTFKRADSEKTDSLWIIPICILIVCFIIGTFFNGLSLLTLLMLAIALLLASNFAKLGFLKRFALLITLMLFGLEICTLIVGFTRSYPGLISSYVAPPASFILNRLGYNTESIHGSVLYQSQRVFCDLIKSGFYLALGFSVGFSALVLESKINFKRKLKLFVSGISLHYIVIIIFFIYTVLTIPSFAIAGIEQIQRLYWQEIVVIFSILAFIWFLIFKTFASEEGISWNLPAQNINRVCVLIAFFSFLSIFSLFAAYNFYGFNDTTDTVIIFDEIHSEWEPTTLNYTTTYFGALANNNYHLFADYISRFYPVYILSDRNVSYPLDNAQLIQAQQIDKQLLEFKDKKVILVLKCLTKPLSDEEIGAVLNFVRDGGSLFLIGDHTDVYLMNTYLNNVSKHLGIIFNFDASYMMGGGWLFTDKNDYAHHLTTHYLDELLWATGCSLDVQPPARAIAFSPFTSFNDRGDYHNEFFFGNARINPEEIYGSYPVMAVSEYGKGKAFAFTDSTCFSNPLLFYPGRRELMAGVIYWLSCSTNFNLFIILFLFSFIGFIVTVILLRTKCLAALIFVLLLTAPVAGITGSGLACYLNDQIYKSPEPIHALPPQIIFDDTHGTSHCIALGNTSYVMRNDSYNTFYAWIGRLGMYPYLNYKQPLTEEILEKYAVVVIIAPRADFSEDELDAIEDFVKNGGGLLLIEGASQMSTINQVAQIFNLTFDLEYAQMDTPDLINTNPTQIYGGILMENVTFASYSRYGEGLVIAVGDDLLFTNQNLIINPRGYPATLEWRILEALVNRSTFGL